MEQVKDLIIVGSGPAGLAASIYAARAELDFVVLEREPMSGGQIVNTYEVDNYPGMKGIGGFDLAMKFREHADALGVKHIYGEPEKFEVTDGIKKLTMKDGSCLYAKTVIIATGAKNRKLKVEGEERLTGMGVSYCATCDGAFFRNRVTAVVGGGDVAVEDAIFLARMCKKVYVIHRRDDFRAAKTLCSRLRSLPNVTLVMDSAVEEIKGQEQVESAVIKNLKTGEETELELDGIFIAVGNQPVSEVFQPLVKTDQSGYIIADETGKTNIPGVFAAGDVRTKQLRQIITAAADGASALTSVERYLSE